MRNDCRGGMPRWQSCLLLAKNVLLQGDADAGVVKSDTLRALQALQAPYLVICTQVSAECFIRADVRSNEDAPLCVVCKAGELVEHVPDTRQPVGNDTHCQDQCDDLHRIVFGAVSSSSSIGWH